MSELLHEADVSGEPGSPEFYRYPLPPTVEASILNTRPWPIRQKRVGTSWVVSHIAYNHRSYSGQVTERMECHFVIRPPPSMYHKVNNAAVCGQWAIKHNCQNDSTLPSGILSTETMSHHKTSHASTKRGKYNAFCVILVISPNVAGLCLEEWLAVGPYWIFIMTSSNGNIFRVTAPLCGEFTGPGEFPTQRPVTLSFDVFFDLCLNKRLSKQSWGWWFETLSWSLWRHSNACRVTQVRSSG